MRYFRSISSPLFSSAQPHRRTSATPLLTRQCSSSSPSPRPQPPPPFFSQESVLERARSLPNPNSYCNLSHRHYCSSTQPSARVSEIVNDISGLTLMEVADLAEVLRQRFDISEMPIMTVMMPGMGMSMGRGASKAGASEKSEEKVEKTVFDLKLEGFDAASKIKIIKEVRTFTDLGLKEAKDLVEKTPTVLKKGVLKEEAEKIIEKMKGVGAKVVME
ncbi:uncharacterized protein LOC18429328 [Amborella trichopoda]|uniref:Ribosomal protein L7/L12 C-terminal domain-containing protein n=1 Tax=Amborella trichopoda TaxID=13333 RepID=W1P130_AMBTC|nr:uncharacterized protein LOC18429328 [Amborella trichopoda]ERN01246.1 hypothetical protein AMTR_s00002p00244430 [Amborella trichopoda]|eukprot:XP_006838677.1 uncharacterized protein LOC18429328 [Amborella trichopoda]